MLLWPGQRAAAGKQTSAVGAKAQQQQQQQPPHSLISSTAEAGASSSALFAADPGPSSAHTTSYVDAEAEGCVEQDDEGDAYFDDEENEDDDQLFETMDDTPAKIQPGLLIGSFLAEQNKEKLRRAGVTHVLQVAEGLTPSHPDDFSYLGIQVMDCPSEDLVAHFARAFQFIDSAVEQQGACFVHCVAGVSRSSTVCIGWLMSRERLSYDDAFRRVHAVRPWIMPNIGFRRQLQLFEELGCDLGKWRAWRHREVHGHDFDEEPAAVVSLAGLGIRAPAPAAAGATGKEGSAGTQGAVSGQGGGGEPAT